MGRGWTGAADKPRGFARVDDRRVLNGIGFCVLRVKARGKREPITVVGHAAVISAGEFIQASGEWANDRTQRAGRERAPPLAQTPPSFGTASILVNEARLVRQHVLSDVHKAANIVRIIRIDLVLGLAIDCVIILFRFKGGDVPVATWKLQGILGQHHR
jgi:hypothetical protein